jgi:hypothetical protein
LKACPALQKKPGGKGPRYCPFPHRVAHRQDGDEQESELIGPLAVETAHLAYAFS